MAVVGEAGEEGVVERELAVVGGLRMYFMYVDESGDTGLGAGSSDLFILSAIIVHEAFWTDVLNEMYRIRRGMYEKHGFGTTREMHAENMLGRHRKNGPGMSRRDCVLMLREVIRTEANLPHVRSMSVVVDKRDKNPGFNVFEAAWRRTCIRAMTVM